MDDRDRRLKGSLASRLLLTVGIVATGTGFQVGWPLLAIGGVIALVFGLSIYVYQLRR